jgi:predicted transcriptional regulator
MQPKRRSRGAVPETTTTVTLPVSLMERAKILAIKRRTTLKAVIIAALTAYLDRQKEDT